MTPIATSPNPDSLKKRLLAGLLAAGLIAPPAVAEELVAEYRGSYSRNTPEFEVQAPWILDWRVTTEGARDAAVDVSLEAAGLGSHVGRVIMIESAGNGVRLFDQGGRFYFRVDSSFSNWHLKVIELTEEEAALYTPKGQETRRR